ncbi:MAG: hypothetical protein ABR968_06705 [Bacteroidales bacterium]
MAPIDTLVVLLNNIATKPYVVAANVDVSIPPINVVVILLFTIFSPVKDLGGNLHADMAKKSLRITNIELNFQL